MQIGSRSAVEPVHALERPVTLAEIKAEPALAKMELIRQSRLSVAPVRDEEWTKVLALSRRLSMLNSQPVFGRAVAAACL